MSLILVSVLFWTRRTRKRLREEQQLNRRMAELELYALRAQMNPHFVFNALGAIQYYIQINARTAADKYLTQFARLMRKYLLHSKEKMIPLKEELELLNLYVDLEQMRFESMFSVDFKIDDNLNIQDHYVPSMMMQPFIENAINHGLGERMDDKGKLEIIFYDRNGTLYCEIKDNGIGVKNAQQKKKKQHKSRGMEIIDERIQTLKASEILDIQVDISELNADDPKFPGTFVHIKMKNLENHLF